MDQVTNPLSPAGKRKPLVITKNTRFISVTQMAERYSISTDTVWRWSRDGLLPAPIKINPQVTRWRLDEVEARDAARQPVEAA